MSGDHAADSSDLLEAKVPRTSGIAIHYPGYIRNRNVALETLGGEEALHKSLQDAAGYLKLRLRPEDQHSHPLFGERRQETGLVLRISRPRDQPDAEPTIQVVSRVTAAYTFTGMADYQFLGADHLEGKRDISSLIATRNNPATAEPFRKQQPFLLVPPLFSKGDMPVAFAFRDQVPLKESEVAEVTSRKRIISFYDPDTPPELPLDDAKDYQSPQIQQQLDKLKVLLAERPAWPVELLLEKIPGSTAATLNPALQALCYQFKTGPWKYLFLRCGFDPRTSVDSRRYQLVSYKLPQDWNKSVKAAKAAGRPMKLPPLSKLLSFSAMPVHHTTHLQLCDLAQSDAAISQLVQQAPVPPSPSEAYGWFTYSSHQQLQQAMQIGFSKVLKQQREHQQPSDAMEVDSATAAAAAAAAEAQQAEPLPPQQQQQQPATEQATAGEKPAAAAAAEPLEGLVSMLGLGPAQNELQQWLSEEAAAVDEQQRQLADAGDSGGESTDAGLSEGESDWGLTSGGETTGDEGTDLDGYDGYNEDV